MTDDQISVFVRDRGRSFVLEEVAEDRHGISESIVGRVERLGGSAVIRTKPGSGTEVAMTLCTSSGDAAARTPTQGLDETT